MWILDNGIWLDLGVWDDTDFWQDYPVGGVILAADGGSYELSGTPATLQIASAVVEPPFGGAGIVPPLRPRLVVGAGYGILPPLQGEAFGVVGAVGIGVAPLPDLKVFGAAVAGAAGHSQARLVVKAVSYGDRGSAGLAVGQLAGIKAAGIIKHDDDEAVALKFLLDA